MKYWICLFIFIFALNTSAKKDFAPILLEDPASSDEFYTIKNRGYTLVFHETYLKYVDTLRLSIQKVFIKLMQLKKLAHTPVIILPSPQAQHNVTFATTFPFWHTVIYPSQVLDGLNFLTYSNFDNLLMHEMNHLTQFHRTILPFVGTLIPDVFTEGDSSFKESWFKKGLLYSGFSRTVAFAQIRFYRDDPEKFIKYILFDHNLIPYEQPTRYIHGAHLFAALSSKYSIRKVNSFFKNYLKIYLHWILNNASKIMEMIFSKDLLSFFEFYLDYYYDKAKKQKISSGPTLFESKYCLPFSKIDNEIVTLTSDAKSLPHLIRYNTQSHQWSQEPVDLPLGKVFKINGEYLSRSNQIIKDRVVQYSLFKTGYYPHLSFNKKFVQDIQDSKILYIDSTNTLDGNKLYLNDQYYDTIHSNALLSPTGDIVYFKEVNNEYALYKNKKPLLSVPNASHIIDFKKDGSILFIAPSPYGSSVFQYSKGQIQRVTSSDAVIEAKLINNEKLLICEFAPPFTFKYKIAFLKEKDEQPVHFTYHFEEKIKKEKYSFPKKYQKDTLSQYSPFSNFVLKYMDYSVGISQLENKYTLYYGLELIASDLLQKHLISPSINLNGFKTALLSLKYKNRTNRNVYWSMKYESLFSESNRVHSFNLDLNTLLFKRGHWMSDLQIQNNFTYFNLSKDSQFSMKYHGIKSKDFLTTVFNWSLTHQKRYPALLLSLPKFKVEVASINKYDIEDNTLHPTLIGELKSSFNTKNEFYFTSSIRGLYNINNSLDMLSTPIMKNTMGAMNVDLSNTILHYIIGSFSLSQYNSVNHILAQGHWSASLLTQKVIYTPSLGANRFISLLYLIPSVHIQYASLYNVRNQRKSIQKNLNLFEFKFSLQTQWSIGYRQLFQISFVFGQPILFNLKKWNLLNNSSFSMYITQAL